jgi:hypothetical protein
VILDIGWIQSFSGTNKAYPYFGRLNLVKHPKSGRTEFYENETSQSKVTTRDGT